MTIKGTIESIEYRNTAGHEKKVVTLVPDHRQRAFVEFRGRRMADLVMVFRLAMIVVVFSTSLKLLHEPK